MCVSGCAYVYIRVNVSCIVWILYSHFIFTHFTYHTVDQPHSHICTCSCVHVCTCACVCENMHVPHKHVCMCVCVYVCMCVCVYVCMCVCVYVCMCVCVYVCRVLCKYCTLDKSYLHICMCACACVCVCVLIYHTYIQVMSSHIYTSDVRHMNESRMCSYFWRVRV